MRVEIAICNLQSAICNLACMYDVDRRRAEGQVDLAALDRGRASPAVTLDDSRASPGAAERRAERLRRPQHIQGDTAAAQLHAVGFRPTDRDQVVEVDR